MFPKIFKNKTWINIVRKNLISDSHWLSTVTYITCVVWLYLCIILFNNSCFYRLCLRRSDICWLLYECMGNTSKSKVHFIVIIAIIENKAPIFRYSIFCSLSMYVAIFNMHSISQVDYKIKRFKLTHYRYRLLFILWKININLVDSIKSCFPV